MTGVHTLNTRTPNGIEQTQTLQQLITAGQRAYITRQPPPTHVIAVPDTTAGAGLIIICTDGHGNFARTNATVHAATNRALFDRGATPTLYPIRATTCATEAQAWMTEYRAAAKAARKAATQTPPVNPVNKVTA